MREDEGVLSRAQRRWAWAGLLTLAVNAPLSALHMGDDTWTLSITVALLVAMVILADDRQRRRRRLRQAAIAEPPREPQP